MSTISRTSGAPLAQRGGSFTGRRGGSLARRAVLVLVGLLIVWQKRLRDRDTLSHMSDAQLSDIGIRREDALHEAEKPFWRR